MHIEDFVPVGHENAIKLNDLIAKTGLDNRKCRDMISRYNTRGEGLIINIQDGAGYFIPDETEQELVEIWMRLHISRIREEHKIIQAARAKLSIDPNQMEFVWES